MSRPQPWRVVASKFLLKHPYLRVIADTLEHPDDGRRYQHFLVDGGRHAVAVVALTDDGNLLLTRQYRHGVKEIIFDLPAGRVDSDEDFITAAARELEEETGYRAGHIEPLTFYNQFPGGITTGGWLFFAKNLVQTGERHLDENEEVEVVEMPVADVLKLILDNRTPDGSLMLGVLFARAKGLI